jgi:hypothetical protein
MRGGVLAAALLVGAGAATAEPDELVGGGCRVRTVALAESGVAEVEARCAWDVPADAVLAILRDPERLGAALDALAESRRLADGRILQVHTVGWPLADRQVTLDWREEPLDAGGARFVYGRSARQEPLGAGRVEIAVDEGLWEVSEQAGGGTALVYTSRYDAGGALEPFLVRRFQREGIARSLAELRAAASYSTSGLGRGSPWASHAAK